MLGKVGYQVSQVKDQVGQGQGQELDNWYVMEESASIRYYHL